MKIIRIERSLLRLADAPRVRRRSAFSSVPKIVLALTCTMLAAIFIPSAAIAAQAPAFNTYFSGTENLVFDRLKLTHRRIA